jgi:histidinol-phosphate aminotransferase
MRKEIADLAPYLVEQDSSAVKLNQNESPYDVPDSLKKAALERLAKARWNRYPDHPPQGLIEALARHTGWTKDGIVAANSSNEIILAIAQTFCAAGDGLVVVSPGFPMYPRVGRILGLKVTEVPLAGDFQFDVRAIIDASRNAALVMIASPNNPTGTAMSPGQILDLVRNVEGTLVIDEAYCDFHKKTSQQLLKSHPNLILIRTFSKAFGLAGARIGYLLAQPEVARTVDRVKLPFSVGVFQQVVGLSILENGRLREQMVERIIRERARVQAALRKIPGISPIPSRANFILFRIRGKGAPHVCQALRRRGVLVRSFDHPRLEDALRVTIGTRRENGVFLKMLRWAMTESDGTPDA